MSTDIVPFSFEGNDIRIVIKNGDPWFVGVDVAKALGYETPRATINNSVDEDYKGVYQMDTPGGVQNVVIIAEPGMYKLSFGSRLPAAKRFTRWVTEEVLPQIRKTGSYSIVPKTLQQALRDHADALDALEQAEKEIEAAKPKVIRYDMLQRVDGGYNRWSVGRALGFDGQLWRFTDHLIRLNALEYGRRGRLSPTDEWIEAGWIEVRGEMTTVITEDGFKHLESLKLQ